MATLNEREVKGGLAAVVKAIRKACGRPAMWVDEDAIMEASYDEEGNVVGVCLGLLCAAIYSLNHKPKSFCDSCRTCSVALNRKYEVPPCLCGRIAVGIKK